MWHLLTELHISLWIFYLNRKVQIPQQEQIVFCRRCLSLKVKGAAPLSWLGQRGQKCRFVGYYLFCSESCSAWLWGGCGPTLLLGFLCWHQCSAAVSECVCALVDGTVTVKLCQETPFDLSHVAHHMKRCLSVRLNGCNLKNALLFYKLLEKICQRVSCFQL